MSSQHQPGVSGVTEIRVHGVGGTSPVSMLGRSDLVQVAGDEISGFYRSTQTEAGRTIEAYSWGGLTASSASRALWVLLLPFSLVNIAGWMIEPARERTLTSNRGVFAGLDQAIARFGKRFEKASGRLRAAQEWLVHLLALAFTATYVQLTAYLAVDLFAFQCGGDGGCRARLPLNAIFGEDPEVGRRLVIGMAAPVLLLFVFLFLARRSRLTYESFRPQDAVLRPAGATPLEDPLVWDRVKYQKVMARLHATFSIGALMITFAGTATRLTPGNDWRESFLYPAGIVIGALLAVGSVIVLGWIASRRNEDESTEAAEDEKYKTWNRASIFALLVGVGLLAALMVVTWSIKSSGPTEGVVTWFGLAPLALLTSAIAIGVVIAGLQAARWVFEGYLQTDQFLVVIGALVVAIFPYPPVFAVVAIAILLLNVAAPPVEGRTTAWWDLGILTSLAVVGFVVSVIVDERAYLWAGVAISTVAAAFLWLARRPEPGFRWAGTGAVGAFAAVVLLGIFSGLIVRTAIWLSDDDFSITYPDFYQWAVVVVTLALVAVVIALGIYGARAIVINRAPWEEEAEARLTAAGYPDDARNDVASSTVMMRGIVEAAKGVDVMITLAGVVIFAAFLSRLVDVWFRDGSFGNWFEADTPAWAWLLDLAAWLSLLAVLAAYFTVRSGLRSEATRRKIGMVWDVASFFPRSFHPLAPPAYAARAVPEIQARIREIVENGGKVILTGHSQGSVIVAAVMASLPEDITRQMALVTYGSPIGKFYRPYFPAAIPDDLVVKLVDKIGPSQGPLAGLYWLNFYRPTDPIADRALKDGEADGLAVPGELITVLEQRGRMASGGDVVLEDPWEVELEYYRPIPRLRGHSGYESDPAWIGCVEGMTDLLHRA